MGRLFSRIKKKTSMSGWVVFCCLPLRKMCGIDSCYKSSLFFCFDDVLTFDHITLRGEKQFDLIHSRLNKTCLVLGHNVKTDTFLGGYLCILFLGGGENVSFSHSLFHFFINFLMRSHFWDSFLTNFYGLNLVDTETTWS